MPQTVDRIDFACTDIEPSQWPKLSCGSGGDLALAEGNLRLDADRAIFFTDNGQLRSFDDKHKLVFDRTNGLLELHEAGAIRFLTGAPTPTEKLRIRADGNVGVGIDTPGAKLHVAGAIQADGNLGVSGDAAVVGGLRVTGGVQLDNDTQVQGNLQVSGIIDALDLRLNNLPLRLSQWEDGADGVSYTAGNVGIGAQALSAYRLTVAGGDTHLDGALTVTGNVALSSTLTTSVLHLVSPAFTAIHYGNRGKLGATSSFNPDADQNGLWIEGSADGSESGGLFMNGNTICLWSPGDNDLLRVYDEDDFSIPKFVIGGNGDIRAGNSDLYFTKTDHNHTGFGNTAGYAAIENAADYGALMILGRAGTARGRYVRLWDYLQVNGSMDVTGNVGIGTTPGVKLHVIGNRIRLQKVGVPSHTLDLRADGSAVDLESSVDLYLNNNNVPIYYRNLNRISSRALKEQITELADHEAVALLEGLQPVRFIYKDDANQEPHLGFIAEDVPAAIATADRKGISSMNITAVLCNMVRQHQQTIATLCTEIQTLKAEKHA